MQISCNNENIPRNLKVGGEIEFHCVASKTFRTCIIERISSDMKTRHCNFTFYSPPKFTQKSVKSKELQKVQWDCNLDYEEPYRIQVLDAKHERKCRVKIKPLNLNGSIKWFCFKQQQSFYSISQYTHQALNTKFDSFSFIHCRYWNLDDEIVLEHKR